jgi:hypothetical protein
MISCHADGFVSMAYCLRLEQEMDYQNIVDVACMVATPTPVLLSAVTWIYFLIHFPGSREPIPGFDILYGLILDNPTYY